MLRSCAGELGSYAEPVLEWLVDPTAWMLTDVTDGSAKCDDGCGGPVGDLTEGVEGTDSLATLVALEDIFEVGGG